MRATARTNERVAGLPLSTATLGRNGAPAWEPNWIDYRSSVANVERRAARGDIAETCRECGCEIDITPEPHSPKCPTLVEVAVEHGRELLDRMDAGEPLTDEPELEETAAVGERAESGAAPLLVGEPERAAVSPSPSRGGSAPKWSRESVIAAIREVAAKVGHTPTHAEMKAAGYSSAGVNTTLRRIGATWAELVREAGYEPNTRAAGGRKGLGRAARSAPAARQGNTAGRPAESEREPEATDPAEAEVAPSRRALLAAEGAASRSDVLLRAVALAARAFADAILEESA